jgi:hypothetical protein
MSAPIAQRHAYISRDEQVDEAPHLGGRLKLRQLAFIQLFDLSRLAAGFPYESIYGGPVLRGTGYLRLIGWHFPDLLHGPH